MKYILLKIKRFIFVLLFGIPVTIWLLMRNFQTIYYIPHIGIGEYCIALGYLESYKKMNNIAHVTLVVPPNRIEVAKLYPYWDSLLVLKNPLYLSVACLGSIPFGRSIHRKIKRIVSVSFALHINKKLLHHNPGANADDLTKIILKIPYSEERKAPCVPEINLEAITCKYDLHRGKTILLNPYTSGGAVQEIPIELYEMLTVRLKQEGFSVATIISNESQKPVKGTQGIITSLIEAWHLVRWSGWLIGTRSGFFDFVQLTGSNIIALYDSQYKLRELFSLKANNQNRNINEYIWEPNQKEKLVENIVSDCIGR